MEYFRTAAKVLGGICDKDDLLGEQSVEMVGGLLDKELTRKQKKSVIEPTRGSLTEKRHTLLFQLKNSITSEDYLTGGW